MIVGNDWLLQTFTLLRRNARIKFFMRFQWMGVVVLFAGKLLSGQQSPGAQQTPPIAVNVKVVNVLATVRDKHGKIVSTLAQGDFTLEEDGKPVTIRYFANETNLPLTLGLLVDTSMSQRRVLDQERAASKTFLDQVLHEKDTAFLIHFDNEVELLQDLTASRPKLESALESLKAPNPLRTTIRLIRAGAQVEAGPAAAEMAAEGAAGTVDITRELCFTTLSIWLRTNS
jgi:VWFA-related protein